MAGIESVNSAIAAKVSGINISTVGSIVGWIIFAIIVLASIGYAIWYWWNKKIYYNVIEDYEVIGNYYQRVRTDTARTVKIGSGGFTLLHLKNAKVFRIGFGGRIGRQTYCFYFGRDGYPYNGLLSAEVYTSNLKGGIVPVITTNPSMRSQYTALEKMIEQLHGEQKSFWDKYGAWILNGIYIAMIGIFTWMIFREFSSITGPLTTILEKMSILVDKFGSTCQAATNQASGLVKV